MKIHFLLLAFVTAPFAAIAQNALAPVITKQPVGQVVNDGQNATFTVEATGTAPLQYRWRFNSVVIPGEVNATLRIGASEVNAGLYDVLVTNPVSTVQSSQVRLTVLSSRLINLATRGFVGSGEQVLIIGFVIAGQGKRLLLRGIGPTLAAFGINGSLGNPAIELRRDETLIATNDNWDGSIAFSAERAGAFPLPQGSRDAAMVVSLLAGNYTLVVKSSDSSTGVALGEVYEIP